MSTYYPGRFVETAEYGQRHFSPAESWREREARADARRERRERARRTVRRRAGPPESPPPDSLRNAQRVGDSQSCDYHRSTKE